MKRLIPVAVGLILVVTMLFALWAGFYGYVYNKSGQPASNARVVAMKYSTSEWDTVYTNGSGYYQLSCFQGWYWMKATTGGYCDIKDSVWNTGGPSGVRVDFHCTTLIPD